MIFIKRLLVRIRIVGVIVIPFAMLYAVMSIYDHLDDAYAQWGAAIMVMEFMCDHNGDWPPDWKALRPYFQKNNGGVGGWTYAEFQSHVTIDFSANSDELRNLSWQSDSVPFDVIHGNSIWSSQFNGGPNEMLYLYFRDPDCPDDETQ